MTSVLRVELQHEVAGHRDELYPLVASAEGLSRWLDGAELTPEVGSALRFRLRDAVAVGRVLAVEPPQHISWTWDWEGEPLGVTTVVAFDLIAHEERTHLTMRHVGFRSPAQLLLHDALWRYWFGRLTRDARRAQRSQPAAGGAART